MRPTPIRLERLTRGVLQIQLAQQAQINRSRLSEIERGYVTPRPEELQRLAAALHVDVATLCPPAFGACGIERSLPSGDR